MNFFTQQGRALLLVVVVFLTVGLAGCGKNSGGDGKADTAPPEKTGQVSASNNGSTFTDDRDGQKYRTVKIGNQTWMAENLRFNIGDSWCYENSEDNCKKYGRLYDWDMAKLACPKGWHLPSKDEWRELVTFVGSETGGKKLKSKSGWKDYEGKSGNGTDDYGFSALPGGSRDYSDGSFNDVGEGGYWWAATEGGSGSAYNRDMRYDYDYVFEDGNDAINGLSVRCVAD